MFLYKTAKRNPELMEAAVLLHQSGKILPDTYVLDYDSIQENAAHMLGTAERYGLELFVMTKQLGRNPLLSSMLIDMGFTGTVTVDYREALLMIKHGIPLAHVGHLVQTPTHALQQIIAAKPSLMTVFSIEKAKEIDRFSRQAGRIQPIMLRVIGHDDVIYDCQQGGIALMDLEKTMLELSKLSHVVVEGVTTFPCFLYDAEHKDVRPTNNAYTLLEAAEQLRTRYDQPIKHINMPSATCTHTIPAIKAIGGTQGEPGHGLIGTTPMHAAADLVETPAIVYVSEISHSYGEYSYCYGGGHYRRSGVERAYVIDKDGNRTDSRVLKPDATSIDYYFALEGKHEVGSTVIFAFRTQIFVTRSDVAIVQGLHAGQGQLVGIYDSLGQPKEAG